MAIEPIQVAYRGLDHGLTLKWIYERLEEAIEAGRIGRPVHPVGRGGSGIPVHFDMGLVEYWKLQHSRHMQVSVPRDLWKEIDEVLGLSEANA